MKDKLTVDHEGWLAFCPIWANEETTTVWPKYKLAYLLDLATYLQIAFGRIYSLLGREPLFELKVRELPLERQFEKEVGR